MKQAYIYSRVSTLDKQSFERQINDLTNVCIQHGYKANQITTFSESISGYKRAKDRPELTRMLGLIQDKPEGITVYTTEISRIGRNPSETRQIIDRLTDLGVPVYIQSLNQFTIENGKRNMIMNIILQVLMEYANLEAETFKTRSKSGLLNSAKKGKAGGSSNFPYGYTKDELGMLVVNQDEVPVINQIFNLYQQGLGIKAISTQLNDQNIPTRTNKTHKGKTINHKNFKKLGDLVKWSDKQVHDILRNPLYMGKRRFKGELLDAPAIISEELYNECQNIMKGKTHRNYLTTYTYLLKDLCTCGKCGRNYFAKYKPVQGGDKAYVCSSKLIKGGSCGNKGINISLIESAIYDLLLSSDEILKYINNTSQVKNQLESDIKQLEVQLPSLMKQLETKKNEQARLLDVYLSGSIDKAIFTSKNQDLVDAVTNLSKQVELVKHSITDKKKALTSMNKVSTTKKMLLAAKDDREVLKGIFQQLIHHVTINATDSQCKAEIRFQINGIISNGVVHLLLDKRSINRSNKVYRYKSVFVSDIEADVLGDDDVFAFGDWVEIQSQQIIKVKDIEHG